MKDILTYKDYIATVHFNAEDEVFYGQIEGIDDLVSFEGRSVQELKDAFTNSVEDYIRICEENGKPTEKTYKGSFNVRVSPKLHKRAAQYASIENVSLNKFVEEAIREKVSKYEVSKLPEE
jgi:predicted HicB family RNase H-like nuclease